MKVTRILSTITLAALSYTAQALSEDAKDALHTKITGLATKPGDSFYHVGPDLVMRSLTDSLELLDAVQLSTDEVSFLKEIMPEEAFAEFPTNKTTSKTSDLTILAPEIQSMIEESHEKAKAAVASQRRGLLKVDKRSCGSYLCRISDECGAARCIGCVEAGNGLGFCTGF